MRVDDIRQYLGAALCIAVQPNGDSDEFADDQLESIIASTICVLAVIKQSPRGAEAIERVSCEITARMAHLSKPKAAAS